MSETPVVKLKETTTNNQALAAAFSGPLGDPSTVETLYDDYLKLAGLDPAVDRQYKEARSSFAPAATYAFSEAAIKAMAEDKTKTMLAVEIPMNGDRLKIQVDRDKETSDGKGGRMIHPAYVTVGYTAMGAGGDVGEMKKVRNQMKDLGIKLLSDHS